MKKSGVSQSSLRKGGGVLGTRAGLHFQGVEGRWVKMGLSRSVLCACVGVGMVIGGFVAMVAPCGEAGFRVTDDGVRVWESPSGGWKVGTKFVTRDLERVERFMENKPPEQEAGRFFELVLRERGVWMGFSIQFGRVQKLVFTKSTKVVLIDKAGKRYESDGIFFYPDAIQSRVFDSRKAPIVVTMKSVVIYPKTGLPLMEVRFPEGAFRLKDLVEFEVVGAIEDTTQRATQ